MTARSCVAIGLVVGGLAIVAGSLLPWMTLFAGLQTYSGMTGPYGWLLCGVGVCACASGVLALWRTPRRLGGASIAAGTAVLAFGAWLVAGEHEIARRPEAAMLAADAGPGLFVIIAGSAILIVAPLLARSRP